ncbi:MAG: DsbA family protein [Gammaproteobacteria bacterium]|nr:MAG: DsbA family protein [Gammaproteobacteria bacterium]
MTTERKTSKVKPQLRLTMFTDYICPFCYIGDLRLRQLWQDYDVLVNFRFIEIHPDTPVQGATVDTLNYSEEKWQGMMDGLMEMAEEEGVELAPVRMLANSRRALLLAEAVKKEGREIFYRLNQTLYEEYFVAGRNIGDFEVLKNIAEASGVSDEVVNQAWTDPEVEYTLKMNMQMAVKAGVTGTPTFFIGQQRLTGAVSLVRMRQAAEIAVGVRINADE